MVETKETVPTKSSRSSIAPKSADLVLVLSSADRARSRRANIRQQIKGADREASTADHVTICRPYKSRQLVIDSALDFQHLRP